MPSEIKTSFFSMLWVNRLTFCPIKCVLIVVLNISVAELAPGGEVYEEFDRRKWQMPSQVQQQVLAEIVVAIEQLHNMNIEHRDLKWDNFAIDSQGHLKLIDFGYAVYHDQLNMTNPNWFLNMDWYKLGAMCTDLFYGSLNCTERNLITYLHNMNVDGRKASGKLITKYLKLCEFMKFFLSFFRAEKAFVL